MTPDPRLLRAWRATAYRVPGAEARIGRRSPALDAVLRRLGRRSGGFVTAWNPLGRKMPEGWNRRMNRRLWQHLRRLPALPGVGEGRGWSEEHFLVAADPRRIVRLARLFRQLGIVELHAGRPARLRLLAWKGEARRQGSSSSASPTAIRPPSSTSA